MLYKKIQNVERWSTAWPSTWRKPKSFLWGLCLYHSPESHASSVFPRILNSCNSQWLANGFKLRAFRILWEVLTVCIIQSGSHGSNPLVWPAFLISWISYSFLCVFLDLVALLIDLSLLTSWLYLHLWFWISHGLLPYLTSFIPCFFVTMIGATGLNIYSPWNWIPEICSLQWTPGYLSTVYLFLSYTVHWSRCGGMCQQL